MRLYSEVILLLTVVSMTACTLPKTNPSSSEDDNATFYVSSDGVSFTSEQINKETSIPVAKTFSYKACLLDRKYSRPVQNHSFKIQNSSQSETIAETTSDSNGCVHWNETINYDHLSQAHFVEQKRIVLAQGVQKGSRTVRFAINPWESNAFSLRDREVPNLVSESEAAQTFSGKITTKGAYTHQLKIQDMRVSMYDTETLVDRKVRWNIELRSEPDLIVTKASGEIEHQPLKSALFDAEISLIHVVAENGKEKRVRLVPAASTDAKVVDGSLLVEKELLLPLFCMVGQIQLGLKLTPKKDSSLNLEPFEGVFILGQCDSIKSNFFSRQKTVFQASQGKMKIEDYLTSLEYPAVPKDLSDASVNVADGQQNYYIPAQVEASEFLFSDLRYENNDSTLNATKTFRVTTCVNAYDRRPLSRQEFEVIGMNGKKVANNPRSDINGCITWQDSLSYHILDRECEKDVSVTIKNNSYGMNQTVHLRVNPWSNMDGKYQDIRFTKTQQTEIKCAAPNKSYILVTGDSFKLSDVKYHINNNLSLMLTRSGTLSFHPEYYRTSMSKGTGYIHDSLPAGDYLFRYAFVTNTAGKASDTNLLAEDRKVLFVGERIVNVLATGEVAINNFDVTTDQVKDLGNTVQIVAEMSLLKTNYKELLKNNPQSSLAELEDKRENFEYFTTAAPTIIKDTWAFDHFSRVSQGESLIIKLKDKQAKQNAQAQAVVQSKLNRKDLFAKSQNLLLVNLNQTSKNPMLDYLLKTLNASGGQLTVDDLKHWVDSGKTSNTMGNKLCELWFDHLLHTPLSYLAPSLFPANTERGQSRLFPVAMGIEGDSLIYKQVCKKQTVDKYFNISSAMLVNEIEESKLPYILPNAGAQHRNLSTGIDFSVSQSSSQSLSTGVGSKLGSGAAKGGPLKGTNLDGELMGGAEVELVYSFSKSNSQSNGASVQMGTSLDLDIVPLNLSTKNYEKCLIIKLNPRLYAGNYSVVQPYGDGSLSKRVNPLISFGSSQDISVPESAVIFSKGFMLCDGAAQEHTVAKKFVETFYFVNQGYESSSGAMMSSTDANRKLFVALRGQYAWLNFMGWIRAKMPNPNNQSILDTSDYSNGKDQDYIRYGLEHAFMGVQSWPGIYVSQ